MSAGSAPVDDGAGRVVPDRGTAYWLSGAVAVVAAASALLTYLGAGVPRGPAVMNGSARGSTPLGTPQRVRPPAIAGGSAVVSGRTSRWRPA